MSTVEKAILKLGKISLEFFLKKAKKFGEKKSEINSKRIRLQLKVIWF